MQARTREAALSGVDWWVMRIVLSEHLHASLPDVAREWSYLDQLHAHKALDCMDDVRDITRPEPPKRGA